MAESNNTSNPQQVLKKTIDASSSRMDGVENFSEKRREECASKRKTVLAKPASVNDANDDDAVVAKSDAVKMAEPNTSPKQAILDSEDWGDDLDCDGEITAERRKPTRVDNEIPASLRDANETTASHSSASNVAEASNMGVVKSSGVSNARSNRNLSGRGVANPLPKPLLPTPGGGANTVQSRPLPNPGAVNPPQIRVLPGSSAANPAQNRAQSNSSAANIAQHRGLRADVRSGAPGIAAPKSKARSNGDNEKPASRRQNRRRAPTATMKKAASPASRRQNRRRAPATTMKKAASPASRRQNRRRAPTTTMKNVSFPGSRRRKPKIIHSTKITAMSLDLLP